MRRGAWAAEEGPHHPTGAGAGGGPGRVRAGLGTGDEDLLNVFHPRGSLK